jgi:iron-sulfur cluster assembly accessory protein
MSTESFDPKATVLTMTPAAAAHVRRQLEITGRDALRLSVVESGCSGYMYELDYTDTVNADDLVCRVAPGVSVCVAPDVVGLVVGTEIDYVREGINATLKFRNPNADAECGCGESFSVAARAADH